MTQNVSGRENGHDGIEVEKRTRRALEEPLSVVALDGTPVESRDDTVVMVVSASGENYHVDATAERCECPDAKHRDPDGGCKHVRRARAALGIEPIDRRALATVNVDEQFAANAPGPVIATSDGGIIDAGDDGEVIDDDTTADERPADCSCTGSRLEAEAELPCWPCYRDGFEDPALVDK
jgi:hypothetical protein